MTGIKRLYSALVKHLRSDIILKDLLSDIYEQAPTNASLPYVYLHFRYIEEICTFDRLTYRAMIMCCSLSNSLEEVMHITEQVRSICMAFFSDKEKYVLSDIRYRIAHLSQNVFQSNIDLEVLISDSSELPRE
ncbi:hypothetical protein O998_02830 [Anaplasma phagocytophilum str. Norway variant1]|uniref:Uncharacterized protein n=1 Tax=Anaplasma phagocytophilum str. Norway variant1 TaxID=1392506 RepID=A0A7H9DZZ3_ANAPH|nr:hypothetical protein [Anaplasma phagocytophilum]QLL66739.1 hypothetical protein O998_02830 [Anaplasma phagocytophilum str. Norway variant1]